MLICMITQVVLWLHVRFSELKQLNKKLTKANKTVSEKLSTYETVHSDPSIELISEDHSENLSLISSTIFLLKSADNYVEISFTEGETFHKKLIRNTLKSIEYQLKPYPNFIRCHRSFIININHIERMARSDNKYWLLLKGFDKPVPVSRQYLLSIKENLSLRDKLN